MKRDPVKQLGLLISGESRGDAGDVCHSIINELHSVFFSSANPGAEYADRLVKQLRKAKVADTKIAEVEEFVAWFFQNLSTPRSSHELDVFLRSAARQLADILSIRSIHESEPISTVSRKGALYIAGCMLTFGMLIGLFVWYFDGIESEFKTCCKNAPVHSKEQFVDLPDSSTVILSGSLCYDDSFGKVDRRVYLEGEGYFEVKSDTVRRFLVIAGETTIRVLGTGFYVRLNETKDTVTVATIHGLVRVDAKGKDLGLVQAGKQLVIAQRTLATSSSSFAHWKADWYPRLKFENVTLDSMMSMIRHDFNVDIKYEGNAQNLACKINAEFQVGTTLDEILVGISLLNNISYFRNAGSIVLRSEGPCDIPASSEILERKRAHFRKMGGRIKK